MKRALTAAGHARASSGLGTTRRAGSQANPRGSADMEPPPLTNMFHQGSLQSGIALAIQEQKLVACFVRGT